MKKYLLYIIFGAALGGFTSCEDMFGDFLDKQPSNELEEKDVWTSWKNTEYYYYDIYNYLRNGLGAINGSWLDSATDIAITSFSSGGTRTSFNIGNYYASKGASEIKDTWGHYFRGIRKCNSLLANIDNVPLDVDKTEQEQAALRSRMKAEARFFRGYFYWELCIRYGALPIIEEALDPSDDEKLKSYKRPESIKENFNWIISEIESSYEYLDSDEMINDNTLTHGRITKGASLAMLSRIKLYLASPQYSSLGVADYQDAADAALLFIENFGALHKLFDSNNDKSLNYQTAINRRAVDGNTEPILWRNDGTGDWWANETSVSFGGNGGNCPTQNLVDMYDMADGSSPFAQYDETGAPLYDANGNPSINTTSGYSDQDPYSNRDPRMYKTVLHNGAIWWNATIDMTTGGKDRPTGNANATPTGYYGRKYLDDSMCHYINGGLMYRNWILIRYAEILLNYAEAVLEINGPSKEVFNALQQLRDRVGMTALLSERADLQTKEALRNFIRKERTVELAMEGHRAWDVRRWNVAEQALARPVYGVTISKSGDEFTYTRVVAQRRVFETKMYLYPIPEEEIWKTGMKNNPGWE